MISLEFYRDLILNLERVEETSPFGPDTLVYKIYGKIFALLPFDSELLSVNLKCDPQRSLELRESYPENILPGFHMNKKHWNTLKIDGNLPVSLIKELIYHSYTLVLESIPLKKRII